MVRLLISVVVVLAVGCGGVVDGYEVDTSAGDWHDLDAGGDSAPECVRETCSELLPDDAAIDHEYVIVDSCGEERRCVLRIGS